MTNPTTTPNRPNISDTLANIKEDHLLETRGEVLHIDVVRTVANIFGCHDEDVPKLVQLSDLAANVFIDLEHEDLGDVLAELSINERTFISDFVEWRV